MTLPEWHKKVGNKLLKELGLATGVPWETMRKYAIGVRPSPERATRITEAIATLTPDLPVSRMELLYPKEYAEQQAESE